MLCYILFYFVLHRSYSCDIVLTRPNVCLANVNIVEAIKSVFFLLNPKELILLQEIYDFIYIFNVFIFIFWINILIFIKILVRWVLIDNLNKLKCHYVIICLSSNFWVSYYVGRTNSIFIYVLL